MPKIQGKCEYGLGMFNMRLCLVSYNWYIYNVLAVWEVPIGHYIDFLLIFYIHCVFMPLKAASFQSESYSLQIKMHFEMVWLPEAILIQLTDIFL